MLIRRYRWARRVLVGAAALPLMQATCDPIATGLQIGAGFVNILANSITQQFVSATIQTLLGTFPGSNLLRSLFLSSGFFPRL